MRHRLARGPEYATSGEQRAHHHCNPLEEREFRCLETAHDRLAARQDSNQQADQEGGEKQQLPVKAEEPRRPGEARVDDGRKRVKVHERQHAEQDNESARHHEDRDIDPA